jgi:hypothetical protein
MSDWLSTNIVVGEFGVLKRSELICLNQNASCAAAVSASASAFERATQHCFSYSSSWLMSQVLVKESLMLIILDERRV